MNNLSCEAIHAKLARRSGWRVQLVLAANYSMRALEAVGCLAACVSRRSVTGTCLFGTQVEGIKLLASNVAKPAATIVTPERLFFFILFQVGTVDQHCLRQRPESGAPKTATSGIGYCILVPCTVLYVVWKWHMQ